MFKPRLTDGERHEEARGGDTLITAGLDLVEKT